MDDMTVFERQVAGAMAQRAGPTKPVDDQAIFEAIGAATQPSRWSFRSLFGAATYAVAGAIVALFGGFLLAGMLTQPGEQQAPAAGSSGAPETTFENLIELPAEIPDSIESGSLETSLGPARWARIVGNEDTVPAYIDPHPAPGGFISVDERELWRSSDLVTWVPEGLSVPPGASLLVADGVYWLTVSGEVLRSTDSVEWEDASPTVQAEWTRLSATDDAVWALTSEPMGLWRATDAATWEEIDLGGLESPGPALIDWDVHLNEPVGSGAIHILPVTYAIDDLNGLLGIEHVDLRERVGLKEQAPGVYTAFEPEFGGELATLTFDDVDGDLEVVDAADGTLLARLDGIGIDDVGRWAARGGPDEQRFYLVEGNDVVPIEMPGSDFSDPSIFGSPDGFLAYLPGSAAGPAGVWRSEDGMTWAKTDPPSDMAGEPAHISWGEHPERPRGTAPIPPHGSPRAEGSWYRGAEGAEPLPKDVAELAFEAVTELAVKAADERGSSVWDSYVSALSPNTVVYATTSGRKDEETSSREIWIVTFDDLD